MKLNGLGKQVLGDCVEIIDFSDMRHGWTVRGDLANPAIKRDVKKAFNLVLAFSENICKRPEANKNGGKKEL